MEAREAIALVLKFREMGFITSDEVVAWADSQILACDQPDNLLLDLSLEGPERCLRMPEYEFPARPRAVSFAEEFSARALKLSLGEDRAVRDFAVWVANNCIFDDHRDELFVQWGYMLDHLIDDMRDEDAAIHLVREELPGMLGRCRSLWPFRFEDVRIG